MVPGSKFLIFACVSVVLNEVDGVGVPYSTSYDMAAESSTHEIDIESLPTNVTVTLTGGKGAEKIIMLKT